VGVRRRLGVEWDLGKWREWRRSGGLRSTNWRATRRLRSSTLVRLRSFSRLYWKGSCQHTFDRSDLPPQSLFHALLPALHHGKIDVILAPRHEPIDNDDGLVGLFVHPDEDALPVDVVDANTEAFAQRLGDEGALFLARFRDRFLFSLSFTLRFFFFAFFLVTSTPAATIFAAIIVLDGGEGKFREGSVDVQFEFSPRLGGEYKSNRYRRNFANVKNELGCPGSNGMPA